MQANYLKIEKENVRFPIHFDVPQHSLVGSDYITAIDAIIVSLDEINKRLFNNQLDLELRVIRNDDGSLKAITGIIVKGLKKTSNVAINAVYVLGILSALVEFSETDTFKGFVEGATGHKINHYATSKEVGNFIHDILIGLFSIENEDIKKIIPEYLNLDRALKAKSNFYSMCINNQEIKGVGFDDTEQFPVKRNRFAYYISEDIIRPTESDFRYYEAVVVSPVDTDHKEKWHLRDVLTGASIKAYMEDEDFKSDLISGKYPLKQTSADDIVKVLIEFKKQEKNGLIEQKENAIHTVYSFNKIDIKPIPTSIASYINNKDMRPMDSMWKDN